MSEQPLGGGGVGVPGQPDEIDRGVAQRGYDLGSGASSDGGVILTDSHITDPVQPVLDAPVRSDPARQQPRIGLPWVSEVIA